MICTSLKGRTYGEIVDILESGNIEMAEIRLDLCNLNLEEIENLFSGFDIPLVATCGTPVDGDWQTSLCNLSMACDAGAHYLDLPIEAPVEISKAIRKQCKDSGTLLIRSYHNYDCTPSEEYLRQIMERCYRYGADIAKIAVTAKCDIDLTTVKNLYSCTKPGRLIALSMGEFCTNSRIESLKMGAPFTYAALNESEATAPGQLTCEKMQELVYGARKEFIRKGLKMPASKSFAQRAIIAAALSEGTSHLYGYTSCDDSESAIRVAEKLGAKVIKGDCLTITGIGSTDKSLSLGKIAVGESGLLARLMIPISSVLDGTSVMIEGEKTLLTRPLTGASDIMASFGVLMKGNTVPLEVLGTLIPGNAEISGKNGSQLISGLLMALPLCNKTSNIFVTDPKSIPYMFITLDVMKKFGVVVGSEMEGDETMLEEQNWSACTQITFKAKAPQSYKAADFNIESDWSSAANFLVAGAIFGGVEIEGLDCKSIQADLSIIDILVEAGACVSMLEDSGTVCVRKAPLTGIDMNLDNTPDLFPIVSVLASFCTGESRLSGISRLRNKESDRASAIVEMLTKMGVKCSIEANELIISGESLCSRILNGHLLKGGEYKSYHDHRIAMALAIASLGADTPIVSDDRLCVTKSFPEFFSCF